MTIEDSLRKIAPTVVSALAGPLAGMAVSALSGMLGANTDEIKATIASGNLTSEQLASLQRAEAELKQAEIEKQIKFAELEVKDRDGARQMQIATRSSVPALLSLSITAGFFAILIGLMAGWLTATDNQALLILLGALGAAWGAVVNYWFGSTSTSQRKTELIAAK